MEMANNETQKRPLGCIIGIGGIIIFFLFAVLAFLDVIKFPIWVWLLVILAIIIGVIAKIEVNNKLRKERLAKAGIDPDRFLQVGKYVAGHPRIDSSFDFALLYLTKNFLKIYNGSEQFQANIELNSIRGVKIEDASTVQKRVTVGRLLAVGVFAFAWKKKIVEEMAYLVIEWNDGKFDHETIFELTGKNSISKANTVRNKIIASNNNS